MAKAAAKNIPNKLTAYRAYPHRQGRVASGPP